MQLSVFQVDAFTDRVFGGNPAVVCPLESWLPTEVMQQIAMENAVAETAFFVPLVAPDQGFAIRWFTPEIEMDLCGHATLATAHVLAKHLNYQQPTIQFESPSGRLFVTVEIDFLTLNFPARPPQPVEAPAIILDSLNFKPIQVLKARDYLLIFEHEEIIRQIKPNQQMLNQINIDPGGIIVTAPSETVDFVSRFFTPQASIFEDPVTGSAHCSLIPYWSEKLGKDRLTAMQLSSRVGQLFCQWAGKRVLISGTAVTYMQGTVTI